MQQFRFLLHQWYLAVKFPVSQAFLRSPGYWLPRLALAVLILQGLWLIIYFPRSWRDVPKRLGRALTFAGLLLMIFYSASLFPARMFPGKSSSDSSRRLLNNREPPAFTELMTAAQSLLPAEASVYLDFPSDSLFFHSRAEYLLAPRDIWACPSAGRSAEFILVYGKRMAPDPTQTILFQSPDGRSGILACSRADT